MKHLIMGVLVSLMMIQIAGATDPKSADKAALKVVAKVNGMDITNKDVDARLAQIPPQYRSVYASEQGRKKFVEQMIQERLIYLQALKEKYDTNGQVLEQLEKAKQNIMVRRFINDTFSKIKADEADMKAYYETHAAEFTIPPKIWAKHILCKTEDEAKAAFERVKKGEAFEAVAKDVSTCPSSKKGGDLGWFGRDKMVPEFAQKAFSMEKDDVSEPVKTQFGYHIIKVYGKKEAGTKSFEDAKADLKRKLTTKKQQQQMDEMIDKLKTEYSVTIY